MTCPFLRETAAGSCRLSSLRRPIPHDSRTPSPGLCRSEAFRECRIYRESGEDAAGPHCPLLHESAMQYCAASPVSKLVPSSEAALTRCGSGAFRYCDLYLELTAAARAESCDRFDVPDDRVYTANHLWVDVALEGPSHIGIDSFLARMLGMVTRVEFPVVRGDARPLAVVTVDGLQVPITFPDPASRHSVNLYLRAHPERLTEEPYTRGWLFEALIESEPARDRFARAEEMRSRIGEQSRRLQEYLHEAVPGHAGDGGLFERGLLGSLPRTEALRIYHEYNPQSAGWNRRVR